MRQKTHFSEKRKKIDVNWTNVLTSISSIN